MSAQIWRTMEKIQTVCSFDTYLQLNVHWFPQFKQNETHTMSITCQSCLSITMNMTMKQFYIATPIDNLHDR